MIALLLSLAVAAGCAQPIGGQADPRREPVPAIAEAIRLLEAKAYAVFLERFVRPDDLKEMVAGRPIAAVAREFGERRAAKVLTLLRAASKLQPVMNVEHTRADFHFDPPLEGERTLSLRKVGEYWYIR